MGRILVAGVTEETDQIILVNWFKKEYGEAAAERLHHSPNGGHRSKKTGAKLKMMGTRPGFPDLVLYLKKGGATGLVVELKKAGQKPRPNQFDWLDILESCDFQVHWCDNIEDVKQIFIGYMDEAKK